jgi:hypothetical protein
MDVRDLWYWLHVCVSRRLRPRRGGNQTEQRKTKTRVSLDAAYHDVQTGVVFENTMTPSSMCGFY